MQSPGRLIAVALAAAGVLAALAIGLTLRLDDPASNPVMAAEDPYTHMSLVREHLRDGRLEPQNPQGALYPPGLHGFLAAWWAYSGAELYDLMRFGPVVFGGAAILGVAVLLGRWEGGLAAFVGALLLAAMPEEVHRTTMMSPTALDLALLPFLLLALLEVVRGRLAWAAAAAPVCAFLVLAHPWLLAILNVAGLSFLLLYVVFPWRASRGPPVTREGVAVALALLGGSLGVALATRWEASGTGFSELTLPFAGHSAGLLGAFAVAVIGVLAAVLFMLPRIVRTRLPEINRRPRATGLQALGVLLMAGLLLAIVAPTVDLPRRAAVMPDFVDLPRMIGWPALALATVALLALPLAGGPAAHAAAGLFLATFPFAIHNPLDSPYWPHRTVVFVGFAAALLGGVAARRLADLPSAVALRRAWARAGPGGAPVRRHARAPPWAAALVAVPALVVGSAVGAGVLAATPEPYEGGWYRYYSACEFAEMRGLAERLNRDPGAMVITGSWQSQLVLAAFTDDGSRVWFKSDFFHGDHDPGLVGHRAAQGKATYVVVDRWIVQETPGADWSFLDGPSWEKVRDECPSQGALARTFQLWQLRRE